MNTDYRPSNSWDFRLRAAKLGELMSVRSLATLTLTVALIALLATLAALSGHATAGAVEPLRPRSPQQRGASRPTTWAEGDQFRLTVQAQSLDKDRHQLVHRHTTDYNTLIYG